MDFMRWKKTQWAVGPLRFLNVIWVLVSETQDLSTGLMENVSCSHVTKWRKVLAIKWCDWEEKAVRERREESHALISNGKFMESQGCGI